MHDTSLEQDEFSDISPILLDIVKHALHVCVKINCLCWGPVPRHKTTFQFLYPWGSKSLGIGRYKGLECLDVVYHKIPSIENNSLGQTKYTCNEGTG